MEQIYACFLWVAFENETPSIPWVSVYHYFSRPLSQFQPDVTELHLGLSVWMKGRQKLCQILLNTLSEILLVALLGRQPPYSKHSHRIHPSYSEDFTIVFARIFCFEILSFLHLSNLILGIYKHRAAFFHYSLPNVVVLLVNYWPLTSQINSDPAGGSRFNILLAERIRQNTHTQYFFI